MQASSPRAWPIERLHGVAWTAALLGALAWPGGAAAQSCYEKVQTQGDLVACSSQSLKRADTQLGTLYQRVIARLGDDGRARAALTAAQRNWFDFRDAECRFATLRTQDADIHPMLVNECRARVTRNRVVDLRDALACAEFATTEQAARECTVPAPDVHEPAAADADRPAAAEPDTGAEPGAARQNAAVGEVGVGAGAGTGGKPAPASAPGVPDTPAESVEAPAPPKAKPAPGTPSANGATGVVVQPGQ